MRIANSGRVSSPSSNAPPPPGPSAQKQECSPPTPSRTRLLQNGILGSFRFLSFAFQNSPQFLQVRFRHLFVFREVHQQRLHRAVKKSIQESFALCFDALLLGQSRFVEKQVLILSRGDCALL